MRRRKHMRGGGPSEQLTVVSNAIDKLSSLTKDEHKAKLLFDRVYARIKDIDWSKVNPEALEEFTTKWLGLLACCVDDWRNSEYYGFLRKGF